MLFLGDMVGEGHLNKSGLTSFIQEFYEFNIDSQHVITFQHILHY